MSIIKNRRSTESLTCSCRISIRRVAALIRESVAAGKGAPARLSVVEELITWVSGVLVGLVGCGAVAETSGFGAC